jgi:phage portal protein BeeE
MVQFTNVNPTDRCRGLSPMAPATLSIDTHTAAQKWNKALRDDAGRPSGALVMKQADGTAAALNEEQYQRHCHVNFGYS